MFRKIISIILVFSIISCSVKRASVKKYAGNFHLLESVLYKNMTFDKYGIPQYSGRLKKQPVLNNSVYYNVLVNEKNQTVVSYKIAVKNESGDVDGARIARIIYKWTGKGFETGFEMIQYASPSDFEELIVVLVGFPVIGGLTGFVIGVVLSVPAGVEEFGKIKLTSREIVIEYARHVYDENSRIISMSQYAPVAEETVLAETRYFYKDDDKLPYRFENYSFIEKKKRIVEVK